MAIDGKTSRRTHNRRTGQKALSGVGLASNSRLVLGQDEVVAIGNFADPECSRADHGGGEESRHPWVSLPLRRRPSAWQRRVYQ
jgi:hypothetical protein